MPHCLHTTYSISLLSVLPHWYNKGPIRGGTCKPAFFMTVFLEQDPSHKWRSMHSCWMNNPMHLPVPLKAWSPVEAMFPGMCQARGCCPCGAWSMPRRGSMPQGFPSNEIKGHPSCLSRTFVIEHSDLCHHVDHSTLWLCCINQVSPAKHNQQAISLSLSLNVTYCCCQCF